MIPIIDVESLVLGKAVPPDIADQIGRACRNDGFFYIIGHGVDESLQARLEMLSRSFFALPLEEKLRIRMELGGRAWRGYFPPCGELTSGTPDFKEGIYFGAELDSEHPRVKAGVPLHGPNFFPDRPSGLREAVLEYMAAMTRLAHAMMKGISASLALSEDYFLEHYTRVPLTLFRIFHYPVAATSEAQVSDWGVGEHTDYGLLTILKQDDAGGLEIRTKNGWINAAPVDGAFVCNVGDMLELLTRGVYRSTAHRVRISCDQDRVSFPFFFDPDFDAIVRPVPLSQLADNSPEAYERWDGESVHDFNGTYGDYILNKVSRVFPHLIKI